MAKKKDFVDLGDKLDRLLEHMVDNANKTKAAQDRATDSAESRREIAESRRLGKDLDNAGTEVKRNAKAALENAGAIVGLTASMATLKGVMGDLKGMNSQVSKSLSQVHLASEGSSRTLARFNDSNTGLVQQIETFGDVVDLGMNNFSDDTLKFATQLKAQGVNQKAVLAAMRNNTQVLGMSENASLELADSLISTAAENGDSIEGLVSALDSMKDAMLDATVALGPKAAENMQKVAAMIGQHNSGLQDAAADFVASFLGGSKGFEKAAALGVKFTGEEDTQEFAAKVSELMGKINDMTAGMKGTGSQFALESLGEGLQLSMADINLAQQLEGVDWATDLVRGMTSQNQADLSKNSIEQSYMNSTAKGQKKGLEVTEGIASVIQRIGSWGNGYFVPMAASLVTIISTLWTLHSSIKALKVATQAMSGGNGMGDMLPGKKGRLGKMFSALTGKMGKFGSKMKYVSNVFGKNFLGMFSGKGSMALLKKSGGILAKGASKILGPATAIVTGVMKANEDGKNWVDGLKRGMTSAAIWGAGALLAPVTGGASLIGAAALDATLGDTISEALPGGQAAPAEAKEKKKRSTAELAKQTKVSMLELGVTKDAGFTSDELARIAENTQKNLEFNEEVRNMTREQLVMKQAELEEQKASPITAITGFLAQNVASMNMLITQNETANEQRSEQIAVSEAANQPATAAFSVGGAM